ncbi:MAG: hypothetical protein ACOX88_03985 [Christensenellales bacterium]|jgi:hypothetical protein
MTISWPAIVFIVLVVAAVAVTLAVTHHPRYSNKKADHPARYKIWTNDRWEDRE